MFEEFTLYSWKIQTRGGRNWLEIIIIERQKNIVRTLEHDYWESLVLGP